MARQQMGTVEISAVDAAEGRAILDASAKRLLGMSGDEFARRWAEGETEGMDHVAAMEVAMLLPLAG